MDVLTTSTNYTVINYNPKLEMRKHEKPFKNDRLFIQGGRGHWAVTLFPKVFFYKCFFLVGLSTLGRILVYKSSVDQITGPVLKYVARLNKKIFP